MKPNQHNMRLSTLVPTLLLSGASAWWTPPPGTTWQISLSKTLRQPYPNVTALDADLFDTTAASWSKMKSLGYKTICYFSAGSYEEWRSDASKFNPTTDFGAPLSGWPGERWINTKSQNVRTIMKARMDLAVQKGCDAIDPDNLDAYINGGDGLGLTKADAINYIQFLSIEGHKRGLSVGLKNAAEIIEQVLPLVDFQVNEQCQQYEECSTFRPFIDDGKAVFEIEYVTGTPSKSRVDSICSNPTTVQFSKLIKHMDLDEWVRYCP